MHYSNFGVGLLGQLLANSAAADYRDLILDRVCRPLGMAGTLTGPGPLCATGYRRGRPVPAWEMGALAPAGTLRSSATDLLRYLQAHLHPEATPLAAALRATQVPRVAAKGKDRICLVWNHRSSRYGEVLFHSGGTRGFTAFVGFCPQAGTGVAALVNTTPTRRRNMIHTAYSLFKDPHPGASSRRSMTTGLGVVLVLRDPSAVCRLRCHRERRARTRRGAGRSARGG